MAFQTQLTATVCETRMTCVSTVPSSNTRVCSQVESTGPALTHSMPATAWREGQQGLRLHGFKYRAPGTLVEVLAMLTVLAVLAGLCSECPSVQMYRVLYQKLSQRMSLHLSEGAISEQTPTVTLPFEEAET